MLQLKKLTSAIATGAVLASVMAPGAFASTVTVSGNGTFSDNNVNLSQSSSTTLTQSNTSNVNNDVSVSNSTGGNTSSFNTGGNSSIQTGDATSLVDISNSGGTNIATLPSCGCNQGSSDISITGNGAFSNNKVSSNSQNNVTYNQSNYSHFNNSVDVTNTTGNNQTSFNTGSSNYFSQPDLWNWYWQHQNNKTWNHDQFNNWVMQFHPNFGGNSGGSNSLSTGAASSAVTIRNGGSTNLLQ